jgi:hypothetical protein
MEKSRQPATGRLDDRFTLRDVGVTTFGLDDQMSCDDEHVMFSRIFGTVY